MVTLDELKIKIEETGYYATEELIYDTFNALCMFSDSNVNSGQDIYAICLEGPPGAGKTEFAKTYTKISNKLFNGEVELVDYQCDATTGKTELFEDINISAAIRGDADNVNIPGKLVEAIKKVNSGKKVVLFIDEYDKAREETDAFLLQFLQSGKINSTQHGDLEVEEKYKSNLQVILCKNDMREELSGPLSRRIRIIRLDYMEPATFYKVAHRTLVENTEDKVNDGLLNLVALMYEEAYSLKEIFNRLPSCSEMLIALQDADRLMKRANAPQYIIYNTIIKNMFKSQDDIKTFESSMNKKDDTKLSSLIKTMKDTQTPLETTDLNNLIAENVLADKKFELYGKTLEMKLLIDEYTARFAQMEEKRQQQINEEIEKIKLETGKLVSTSSMPKVASNFYDETAFIKRGYNIFELSDKDWCEVGDLNFRHLYHPNLIEKMVEHASELDIKIYENGILLKEDENIKLIVVKEDKDKLAQYKIMSNLPVIPSTYVSDIYAFVNFANQVAKNQTLTANSIISNVILDNTESSCTLNTLIYNDSLLSYEQVESNVYHLDFNCNLDNEETINNLKLLAETFACSDTNNALEVSKTILGEKKKVLTNE